MSGRPYRVIRVSAWFLGFARANLPVTEESIDGLWYLRLRGGAADALLLHEKIPDRYQPAPDTV